MAKTALEQWDETAANNTDLDSIPTASGTMYPSDARKFSQEIMSQVAAWLGDDTLASAATTDLGSVPGRYVSVTGTTTITALGTIKAGTIKYVKFAGALTLTYNATSLILPGAVNITTAAGDIAILASEGSGNWRCLNYQRASSITTAGWEVLRNASFSAESSIDLIDAGAYVRLRLSGYIIPSDDGVTITIRTRTGGNVDVGGTDYDYLRTYVQAGVVASNSSTGAGAVPLTLSNVGNASQEALHFTVEIEQFNKTTYAWARFSGSETASDGTRGNFNGEWRRLSIVARDGLNIAPSSGTITGNWFVEGLRG